MALIPAPPELKPTIIQMQSSMSESNVESSNSVENLQSNDNTNNNNNVNNNNNNNNIDSTKKRRRRSSSSLISQSEVEKRRREHKTAHSIIEKKRRIRMNREFEALKYLIPACRNSLISGANNNNSEGMYKLNILQATVDYIKYLHQVINIQNNELKRFKSDSETEENDDILQFASIDLDTDKYRNVDEEFDFNQLLEDYSSRASITKLQPSRTMTRHSEPLKPTNSNNEFNLKFQSLPSPLITPELYPSPSLSNPMNQNPSSSFSLKSDFQFPTATNLKASRINAAPSSFLDPQTTRSFSVSSTQNSLSRLEIINESSRRLSGLTTLNAGQPVNRPHSHSLGFDLPGPETTDSDPANVLLSMKKDSGPVSSIQSLLN